LVGYTFEQCSRGGTNGQATHDANALKGVPSRYELTFEDRSLGGTLGGTNAQATHAANAASGQPSMHELTFEDRSLGGTLGGATDMSAEHRARPETQQKFKDAGLDPDKASKAALGGKMGSKPTKGCNNIHFDSIRDKKDFANAADAVAHGWRIGRGVKSKKTGIQPWTLKRQ
jgi:hypothetical protein